jgi:hypothetical protein
MTMGFITTWQFESSFQKFWRRFCEADNPGKLDLGIALGFLLFFAYKAEVEILLLKRILWRFLLLCAVLRCMPYMTGGLLAFWVSGYGTDARRERSKSSVEPPPKIARWLFCIVLSEEQIISVVGDAEEGFSRRVKRYGVKEARSLYYRDVRSAVRFRIRVWIRRCFS